TPRSASRRSAGGRATMSGRTDRRVLRLSCGCASAKRPVSDRKDDVPTETPLHLGEACASKGMRMTQQRRVIARVLDAASDHPDVEELYRRAAAVDPRISISTVYRTVKLFEDAGIITRHEFRDGRARYETIPDEPHDHLIDLRSGRVVEF